MELQGKLLDKDFLGSEVAKSVPKDMKIQIESSDRALSKTLYVTLLTCDNGFWFKQIQIRVSDHAFNTSKLQIIVSPYKEYDKRKRKNVRDVVQRAVTYARNKSLYHKLEKISK